MLLQFIKKLVVTEKRKPGQGIYLIKSLANNYNLEIIDSTRMFATSPALQVRYSQVKDFSYYEFNLPKSLQEQLTYHDLDQAYGAGIETPRSKEPINFSVMYHVVGGGDIAVMTTSQALPPTPRPGIFKISVML